jgi:ribosomal-protein-alanine N-acetyltransferase
MNIIETKRMLIRPLSKTDISELYPIFSNPVTMKFWPAPFSLEQTEGWVQRNIDRYREYGFGRYGILLKENGKLIGDCGVVVTEIDGQIENDLGYIIHHPYWGKGLATEAAAAWKRYAFDTLQLSRLCANMAFDHTASRRVAEKLGLKKEKTFYNQRNHNILTYLYTINDSNFE